MYSYSFTEWLLFFYIYCFFGWCIESAYVSLKEKHFVNRGFLHLPLLPLYGSGAVVILISTIPVRAHIALVFIFGMVAATLLELVTGIVMEAIFKVRYWDYSNQKFNYKGYICLGTSLSWGALAVLLVEVLHKPIERFVLRFHPVLKLSLAIVISIFFVADVVVSVKAAWDLRRLLERAAELKKRVEEMTQKLAEAAEVRKEQLGAAAAERREQRETAMVERREQLGAAVAERREQRETAMVERREQLGAAVAKRREQLEKLRAEQRANLEHVNFSVRSKLKGNPGAVSKKYGSALSELKERVLTKKK